MLPRDWELRLVDLNTTKLRDEDIAWADYVFISAMIVQMESARNVISRCRAQDKVIIAGGPLFTSSHEQFPEVQHFVLGEAEPIMASLVEDMQLGRLQRIYRSDERPDLASTPTPRWDLIQPQHYATMSLQFSRGCPFNCEFCDIIVMNGRVPRSKTPAQLIGELESLVDAGWTGSVFIVDDNFIGNKARAKALLRALIAWRKRSGLNIPFTTEASLNVADDDELLSLLVQAGFRKLFIGIESPVEKSLLECAKTQNTRRDLAAGVRKIQNAGLEVMGGFIVGFDSDSPDIFERQREFIQQTGIVTAMVGLLSALPGTRLWQRLQAEGRILREATGNNLDGVLNFIPRLDPDRLVEGYRKLLRHLYQPNVYYDRILRFLREYKSAGRCPVQRGELMAVIKSLWIMGVAARGRRAFWMFLARVVTSHRRSFGEAMGLAILGHHFRMVAAQL